jgi:hypothetical protein
MGFYFKVFRARIRFLNISMMLILMADPVPDTFSEYISDVGFGCLDQGPDIPSPVFSGGSSFIRNP